MSSSQATKWSNVQNMFALIIGIDEYKNITGLKGACADADAVASFLETQVKVPSSRIVKLRNKEATRTAIFQAFSDLWSNRLIKYNNPILIYFAGHGCEMPRPDGWDTGGEDNIQGICPYDVEMEDSPNRRKFPIPDRTLGAFLNILSNEKGHCITVIFDCCHSASGVRSPGKEIDRAEEFHGRIPGGIDEEYLRQFDKAVPLLNPQSRSYVFIAACGAKQKAREVNGRGKFTKTLLEALKGEGVDKMSFVDFMSSMKKIDQQDPQCEGHLKTRMLFSNGLKLGWGVFLVSQEPGKETYRIEAGLIHGVDKGSLFGMDRTSAIFTPGYKPPITLSAINVHPLYTIATTTEAGVKLPKTGYARQICRGNTLKVHFSTAFLAMPAINHDLLHCPRDSRRKVRVEQDKNKADFIVDVEGRNVVFKINLKAVTDHKFRRLPTTVPVVEAARVGHVLRAASQWAQQHFDISTNPPWINNIELELWSLQSSIDTEGVTVRRRKDKVQTNKKNTVSLNVKPNNNDLYGMVIKNHTKLDLHVSVVVFHIDSLEIEPYFSVAIGVEGKGHADPSLRSGKYLHIGFGNSGGTPFSFDPPKRADDVGVAILKVYFTTVAMDFGWLEQTSPFSMAMDRGARRREEVEHMITSRESQGATALFTIVTHRDGSTSRRY